MPLRRQPIYASIAPPLANALTLLSTNTTTLARFSTLLDSGAPTDVVPVIQQALADYSFVPTNASLYNLSASIAAAINSSFSPPSLRSLLLAQLNALDASLLIVPPYSSTSSEMATYNTYAGVILTYGSASNSLLYMNQSAVIIAQILPLLAAMRGNYTALTPYLSTSTFNESREAALLAAMNASLSALPSTASLTSAIQVIPSLASVIPTLAAVSSSLSVFTSQYLSLPNASTILPLYLSALNSSLPQAEAQFAITQAQLQTFLTAASSLNASANAAALANMAPLSPSLASLANSAFIAYIPTLTASLQSLNFTGLQPLLANVQRALVGSTFNASTIAAFNSLGNGLTVLATFVAERQSDATQWNQGFCSTNPSALCSNATTDCPSGSACLNVGVRRCVSNQATLCNVTAQCPSGDRCLLDYAEWSAFAAQLQGLWAVAPLSAQVAQLYSTMNNVSAAVVALSPFSWQAPVAAAVPVVSAAPSIGSLPTSSAAAAAAASAFNYSAVVGGLSSLLTAVQSINYTAAFSAVNLVNASLTRLSQGNYSQQLTAINAVLSVLSSFLYTVFPANYSASLSPAYLTSVDQGDDALVALSTSLALTLTNITSYLSSTPALSVLAVDGLAQTSTIRAWLHLLYSSAYAQYGAFHYFASVFDQFTGQDNVADPTVDGEGRWDDGPDGQQYAGGRVCMTDTCLHNSVDWYYGQPLSTTTSVNLHLSPKTVTGPLLLLPFFLGLMGLASMCAWWSYRWSSALASVTACAVFCVVPPLFVLAGFAFPVAVLQGDLCYGGANVGYQYVQAKQDTACNAFLGGTGTASDCVVGVDSLNATVDITGLLQAVATGQCVPDNGFDAVYSSLSTAAATWPATRVDTLAEALYNSSSIAIQPTLYSLLDATAANASVQLVALIGAVQSQLSCAAVYSDLMTVRSSFCCSLTSSLYWALSVWFLLSFTLCCCEGPAAIIGRKRFSERLIGGRIAPGVLYDPHGVYGDEEPEDGWRRALAALGLGMGLMGAKRVGEVEMAKSPRVGDALLANGKHVNGVYGKGGAYGDLAPHSPQASRQCAVCLQWSEQYARIDGCGHTVCPGCMRSHVKRHIDQRQYPVLCPLSLLTLNGEPACAQAVSDDQALGFIDEDDPADHADYVMMARIASSIPSTTTPSSPVNAVGGGSSSYGDVPTLKEVMRDRYRPLPGSLARDVAHTPNEHAFINTAGGSLHVLAHPHSDYARTRDGAQFSTSGTAIGPLIIHGQPGTGTLGRTMEGDERPLGPATGRQPCPIVGCGGGGEVGGEAGVQVRCDRCAYVWCVACDTPWHPHQTCEQWQLWRRTALEREVEMYRQEQEQQRRALDGVQEVDEHLAEHDDEVKLNDS